MWGTLKSLFAPRIPTPAPEGFKSLPAPRDAATYATLLAAILNTQSDHATAQLTAVLEKIPDAATDLAFGIHPDQDGEGTFSILLHLGGPDVYVLNKAIEAHRLLFGIRRVDGGLNIAVPLFDLDEVEYPVNDVIANAAADWTESLWAAAGQGHPDLPVFVFSDEDYGDTPRWLQGRPT